MRVVSMVALSALVLTGSADTEGVTESALAAGDAAFYRVNAGGFSHGPVVAVDGEDYYLAGAPHGPDGATDIPGHAWIVGKDRLQGKHWAASAVRA